MEPTVKIKFRKAYDYSNKYKDDIIFTLPAAYRISRDDLNDMDKGGTHAFIFKNKDVASKFATDIFSKFNEIFDVTTNFEV
ncbi:hypothetical protein CA601_00810 [Paraburkholderia hospita]|nr:hypothetical protein CA601_00810 [Paraburkholderia hospita]